MFFFARGLRGSFLNSSAGDMLAPRKVEKQLCVVAVIAGKKGCVMQGGEGKKHTVREHVGERVDSVEHNNTCKTASVSHRPSKRQIPNPLISAYQQ
jgi:hypothetical protein